MSTHAEIYLALERLTARTGRDAFTVEEIIREVQGTGRVYEPESIKVWISTSDLLERVSLGVYRLRPKLPP